MPTRPYDLGKVGWMCNSLAPMLAVFSIIILCFPVSLPVTAKSMSKSHHLLLHRYNLNAE